MPKIGQRGNSELSTADVHVGTANGCSSGVSVVGKKKMQV